MSFLIQAKLHSWPSETHMNVSNLHLYLNGKMLEWTGTFKHLTADQKADSDIQLKRGHFYRSVNGLCYKFKGTLLNSDVATRLFQTCCCSFYGSQAWILSSSSFELICTAWNKAARRIFHLPYNTHRYLLPFIHGWPSTQPNRIAHNLVAHHWAAHNPAARWCAGSVVCITRMGNPLHNLISQTAM